MRKRISEQNIFPDFDLFLSCMVIVKYLDYKKDIDDIKKAIGD